MNDLLHPDCAYATEKRAPIAADTVSACWADSSLADDAAQELQTPVVDGLEAASTPAALALAWPRSPAPAVDVSEHGPDDVVEALHLLDGENNLTRLDVLELGRQAA